MPRARTPDQRREELTRRQIALTTFSKHPLFPDLEAVLQGRIDSIKKLAEARAFGGYAEQGEIGQRWVDYQRGYIRALEWVIDAMLGAEKQLERRLREEDERRELSGEDSG